MKIRVVIGLIAAAVGGGVLWLAIDHSATEKISRFGEYRGYTKAAYDGYVRRSDYLTLADGTRLAYDVLLPAKDSVATNEPLPTLFIHTTYLRTMLLVDDGGEIPAADLFKMNWFVKTFLRLRALLLTDGHLGDQTFRFSWLKTLLEHGYAVVAVEKSGTGASFGVINPAFDASAREADEILNWIAEQPWSNGRIGMFGQSFTAMTQYAAASSGNPHLRAIFPLSASFDLYEATIWPGGIYCSGFNKMFPKATATLEKLVVPVDTDEDGSAAAGVVQARAERTIGKAGERAFREAMYRDSPSSHPEGDKLWEDMGLYTLLDEINESGVAIYNSGGWHDIFARDTLLWHANLTVPRKIHMRPVHHVSMGKGKRDLDLGAEAHRWFDYWLTTRSVLRATPSRWTVRSGARLFMRGRSPHKGLGSKDIDNGIMDEPFFHYYVIDAAEETAWRTTNAWPLPQQKSTRYYLREGRSGSVASVNDGSLRANPPAEAEAFDVYSVDYTATSGVNSRWNAVLGSGRYADLSSNDEKGLTYTTPVLDSDLEVTGHPVVHLWVTADAQDLDFFVYLEEVDSKGHSTYVTEGNLRATCRALAQPSWDNLGLPFQRCNQADVVPLPIGTPVELVFDLLPVSKLFTRGNRIRVTITCADADNFETPVLEPAPRLRLLRGSDKASYILLPVISADDETG